MHLSHISNYYIRDILYFIPQDALNKFVEDMTDIGIANMRSYITGKFLLKVYGYSLSLMRLQYSLPGA